MSVSSGTLVIFATFQLNKVTFSAYQPTLSPDNSVQTVGGFVNWPNPDDHWSDIPLDRLDKWKEWGVKESQNDDGGGVNKRRVDPNTYQPQQQIGPQFPQSLGLYETNPPKSGFPQQQFQPFNSPVKPQDSSHSHGYPFPQFQAQGQSIQSQLPTQNPYSSPASQQSTKEPLRYHSGFFPSNILVEYPETPILSHPEVKSNGLNHPQYISQAAGPQHQGISNVGVNGYQDTRFKKHASNYIPYNVNRIQETPFKSKTPDFHTQNIQNYREPVQIRPFVQFNLKDSVEPYRGQGELSSPNMNDIQDPFMNYNEEGVPSLPYRRQSPGESLGPNLFNNIEDEMSAPPPPPPTNGRFTPPSPFGPRPPRFRMNRPRRRFQGPRRPNNANFGGPQPGPFSRRKNGRQFQGNWTPTEDRFNQQEQTENSVEEDFQPSQNLGTSEGDTDDFYEDDFFKDPDFENFDFSDFEEFQVYDEEQAKNDSVIEQNLPEENNFQEKGDYSENENLTNDANEERSETEMGDGHDMDFNYSREALEMFKKRQQQEYLEQNDHSNDKETQNESSRGDSVQSDEKFDSNFVLESDKELQYSKTPYRPNNHKIIPPNQDEFQMSQEILDYEKNIGNRDPFDQFNYEPSPDDDFAEFDKYFDGFDESMENNLDNNFREGRQAADNQRREMVRNSRNEETLNKLRVITEPFDISDLKYDNELNISRDKLRTLDVWDLENKKIALKKKEDKRQAKILPPPDRSWIPITERAL